MDRARRPRQTARKSTATSSTFPSNHLYQVESRLYIPITVNSRLLQGMPPPTARKSTATFLGADTRTRGYPNFRQGMNQQEFGRNLSKLTRKLPHWSQSASTSNKRAAEPEDGSCPACGWVDKPKVQAVGKSTPKSRVPAEEVEKKSVKEEKVAKVEKVVEDNDDDADWTELAEEETDEDLQ